MLGGTIDENVKLIKPLKKRYKLYGLTNWSAETLPIAMEKYSFFKDLDGIVVSGDEKIVKPDPKIYEILLSRYNLDAESSLFIDDNADNIETAKKMGFKTVHFKDNVNLEQLLKSEKVLC
jgi:2-haloacid dehalogenase